MKAAKFNKAMGKAIRCARMERGMSQRQLGEKIGLVYQQIGKYEAGTNACSAHTTLCIAEALGISVAELYVQAGLINPEQASHKGADDGFLASRNVQRIRNPKLRRAIVDFTRKLAYEGVSA